MSDLEQTVKIINKNLTLVLIVGLSIWGGYNWSKAKSLTNGSITQVADAGNVLGEGAPAAPTNPAAPTGPTVEQLNKAPKISESDHIRGNKNAKVVLLEYSDYECPFCAKFHPTAKQIVTEMGNDVAWVYRHYPLPFHPNAQKSAEGGECVAKLGGNEAFWKYSDALADATTKDGKLSPDSISEAAQIAGVDTTAFKSCLDSDEMASKVQAMSAAGGAAGISGTPGTIVIVNGEAKELIPGALPYDSVKTTVEKYL